MKSLADPSLLRGWLRKRLALQVAEHVFSGLFTLVGGGMLVALTFGFTCLVAGAIMLTAADLVELAFGKPAHFPIYWVFVASGLFIVLLFIESLRTSREYLGTYRLQNWVLPASGGVDSLVALLVNPDVTGKIIADLLFTGPRMVMWSITTWGKALRLLWADGKAAAEVLAVLTRQFHRISFGDLSKLLSGRDPMKSLLVLQELDCVLFLVREPAGVVLRRETRDQLARLLGPMVDTEPPPPPPPRTDEPAAAAALEDAEYYELLGVPPTASLAEIKSAYRHRIKQCHPDKFVGRPAEFRRLAEERAKALNEAYEILSAKLAAN